MTGGTPLRIGFAGQRPVALARAGAWGQGLVDGLERILTQFCSAGPVTLTTGLALGADQMVIVAAHRVKAAGHALQVNGILPCPPALFIAHALADYAVEHGPTNTPATQNALVAHWRSLFAHLDRLQTLPTQWHPGQPPHLPDWALPTLTAAFGPCDPPPPNMTLTYAPASDAILSQSDLLLAIWDGSVSKGSGGTADMIATAQDMKMPVMIIDPRTVQADVQVRRASQPRMQERRQKRKPEPKARKKPRRPPCRTQNATATAQRRRCGPRPRLRTPWCSTWRRSSRTRACHPI